MQGWLFWLGLLQAAPVVATPCASLDRCMQEVHVAASTLTPGKWYPSCDALRERFEVYGEEAKQRLLAVANASNPAERDIAGCLLAGWPAWSPSDLPALKQAISREHGGGWIVRALAKFPVEQAAAVVIPIVEREGGMNQAGFVLGEMMPRALPQVLRRMAHAPGTERDNLAAALSFDSSFPEAAPSRTPMLRALVDAATNRSLPADEREQALRLVAAFGVRARSHGAAIRPLASDGDPRLHKAAHSALRSMLDPSVLGEILASCPPPGTEATFKPDPGAPPPLVDAPGESEAADCFGALAGMGQDAGQVAPQLLPYLKSTSWRWRMQTAEALGLLGNRSVSSALHPLLEDRDWQVVAATILAEVRLGDETAVPALRQVAQTHWFAAVRRAADEAVAALQAGNPKALDSLYRTDNRFANLLWNNPLAKEAASCVLPAATRAPMSVDLHGGTLGGSDRGEFGGNLTWMRAGAPPKLLLERNVSGMLKLSDRTAWVITGLSHMGMEYAAVYRVQITGDGKVAISRLLNLPAASRDLSVDGDGLRSSGWVGSYLLVPADAEGRSVRISQVDCAH
ncbi:HEAT repeat domain-containing protein [Rhodanobacter sp. FDAARGOS 1247]|nr:HEAT repeat domain-containing protein [Rhodanobacter sp. FDAARGOS 1247]